MNLAQVNNLIVNREEFTYSIKFGDVSDIDGSFYTVAYWIPSFNKTMLKDMMTEYADMFTEQTAVVWGEVIGEYYMVSVGHMNMLNNIKIKSHGEHKRA